MGLFHRIGKDRYLIVLILLLIAYFLFINYKIGYLLSYDESRHAVQGHFFYDYFRTLMSGEFMSLRNFLSAYMNVGYNIGWNALYDPPAHAIAQALTFLVFGASPYTARLATMLLVIAGAILFYFFSFRILRNKLLAVTTVFLYLLYPLVFEYARESMVPVPTSFLMLGWFYFFFYKERKYFSIILSKSLRVRLNLQVLIGALFLTAATLMKYQNLIFATGFVAVYVAFLTLRHLRQNRNIISAIVESGAWSVLRGYFFTLLIFVLLAGWWLKFSLLDFEMYRKVFWAGVQQQRYSTLFYFTETAKTTYYAALFAFIPIIVWVKRKKESFLAKNWQILLFVLTVFVIATVVIQNQKIRYMLAAIPLLYILIVQGMYDTSRLISTRVAGINPYYFFCTIVLIFAVLYTMDDVRIINERMLSYGEENNEIVQYIKSIPEPKLLVYPKGGGQKSVNYYATPDLFAFRAMTAKKEYNPQKMNQIVDIRFWDGNLEHNPEPYFKWLNATSNHIRTSVVVFRFEPESTLLTTMSQVLPEMGFTAKNLTYYTVFEKT